MSVPVSLEDLIHDTPMMPVMISCPFPGHDDSRPSARFYPDGHVHCFACGGHANSMVDLVRQREFPNEAMAAGMRLAELYLAKYLGVGTAAKPAKPPAPDLDRGPDSLTLLAMTLFCDAARANLEAHPGFHLQVGRNRGLPYPIAVGVGWADESLVPMVRRSLLTLGYGEEAIDAALVNAGVLGKDNETGRVYYRLRDRLLVPEFRSGPRHAIYYQAREIHPEPTDPERRKKYRKYLNPPGIARPLFGWDSLQRQTERVWIGEGPFDVLPFLAAGEAAVAGMGAHVTARQTAMLAEAIGDRETIVVFDNDDTGRLQSERLVSNLRDLGNDAHAVFPQDGHKDVGEWIAADELPQVIAKIVWELPE